MLQKIWRITQIALAGTALLVFFGAGWLLFYSRDLPDIGHLREFAPTTARQLTDACLATPVTAIPSDRIGKNLRDAVESIEVNPDEGGLWRDLYRAWNGSPSHQWIMSLQVARSLFCNSHDKMLTRHLKELRTAIQLDRRFSRNDLFTIYLNRVPLGDCGVGVENASKCLFHKTASDLKPSQAALIAGMITRPSYYSNVRHPDRAIERRNEVLDAMVKAGRLSTGDASSAKSSGLLD